MKPYVFSVSGVKNTGKTTLVGKIIKNLKDKGYSIATIKHDGHDFDMKDTDSYVHRQAGAESTLLFSANQVMEIKDNNGFDIDAYIETLKTDFVIIEGMKYAKFDKIELVLKSHAYKTVTDEKTRIMICSDHLKEGLIHRDHIETIVAIILEKRNAQERFDD